MSRRALTEEQRKELVVRYRAGATYAQLAAEYGCSTSPIMFALREQGVRARRYFNFPGGGRYLKDEEMRNRRCEEP